MNQPPAIATLLVIGLTCLVTYRAFQDPGLLERLLLDTDRVRRGELRRTLTSGLVHGDWPHFLFNMFSLYSFARYLELVYGWTTFLVIYAASILGGSVVALLLHRHHRYRALGASGGVCGIILASIFLLPGGGVRMFLVPFAIPSWAFAIIFILGSFYGMRAGRDNIGHDAHLGGALVGLLVATLLQPGMMLASLPLFAAVVLLSLGALLYTYRFPPARYPGAPFKPAHWRQLWREVTGRAAGPRTGGGPRGKGSPDEVDRLLDKIARHGLDSLTDQERETLKRQSRHRR
jgi:membrane associated rhomboid family serine protease